MGKRNGRLIRAAAVVAVVSVSALAFSGLAFAAPITTPTLTAPTDGSVVSGDVVVSATSTQLRVQFVVDGVELGSPVAVSSGSATTS